MTEHMLLIPGRSNKQGTSLNKGKLKEEYQTVTSTIEMNQADMDRLGLAVGDQIRLTNHIGESIVTCGKVRKIEDLPSGMLFIPYGPSSSELMESETAGSGMPLSKHLEVMVEKISS